MIFLPGPISFTTRGGNRAIRDDDRATMGPNAEIIPPVTDGFSAFGGNGAARQF